MARQDKKGGLSPASVGASVRMSCLSNLLELGLIETWALGLQMHEGLEAAPWPELSYAAWKDTYATLHLWAQIVGKIRLAQTPWVNHSWHVTLYVSPHGLTTSSIPYGQRSFELEFDFLKHVLRASNDQGSVREVPLVLRAVAEFYAAVVQALSELGIAVRIYDMPNEIPDPIRFTEDYTHASYDAEYAQRFWRILLQVDRVLHEFRTAFIGKCSPVHFFCSFDLAVTRFSGRRAPLHPGGVPFLPDRVTQEAYSHEVSSAGFWPGTKGVLEEPAFYSYAYPEPPGFSSAIVQPSQAYYHDTFSEYVLPYEAIRTAKEPDGVLMGFLMSTYEAAANNAKWDREALETSIGVPGKPRAL